MKVTGVHARRSRNRDQRFPPLSRACQRLQRGGRRKRASERRGRDTVTVCPRTPFALVLGTGILRRPKPLSWPYIACFRTSWQSEGGTGASSIPVRSREHAFGITAVVLNEEEEAVFGAPSLPEVVLVVGGCLKAEVETSQERREREKDRLRCAGKRRLSASGWSCSAWCWVTNGPRGNLWMKLPLGRPQTREALGVPGCDSRTTQQANARRRITGYFAFSFPDTFREGGHRSPPTSMVKHERSRGREPCACVPFPTGGARLQQKGMRDAFVSKHFCFEFQASPSRHHTRGSRPARPAAAAACLRTERVRHNCDDHKVLALHQLQSMRRKV